jgi:predicted NBD/HSP70 family sugar kinase
MEWIGAARRWSADDAMPAQSGATQDEIRRRNLSTLLRQLHVQGAQSRAQLTESMGLNRSTIKALVGELADAGLVSETIPETGLRAGRPSHVVVPRSDTAYVLAANIGVDTVSVAAVGLGGVILARHEYRMSTATKPDAVARRLATEFTRIRTKLPANAWLSGVGVGVPGAVRTSDGLVEFAPNLMWRSAPFGEMLAERLDVHTDVRIGNDGDLGGLAEHVRGSGRGIGDLIYLAGEVGVGGGIIVDGRLVTGSQGYAGELGHMIVNPNGRLCRCGSRGCFETEVGEEAVLEACGRDPSGGRPAMLEVFAAANAGEQKALDGLHETARWVARGLATLVNLFNPDIVILGGPLSSLFFLTGDVINAQLETMTMFAGRRRVRLVPPGLGQDSSLLGAAELAFEPLIADPLDQGARSCVV